MRGNDVGRRSDRSYLCLVAIYVIHALLLNVFLQPKIEDVRHSVTLSGSYFRSMTQISSSSNSGKNASQPIIMAGSSSSSSEDAGQGGGAAAEAAAAPSVVSSTFNSTKYASQSKLDDDDYSMHLTTGSFLQQSRSDGAAIRFLAASKTSGVSGITNNVLDVGRTIVESLSPAALGILAGCLVFLLTFTENDYV